MIWLTTPMQGSPKKRSMLANADWLRATAEVLLKSLIWYTAPMQQRSIVVARFTR